jgi:hypothetical protein
MTKELATTDESFIQSAILTIRGLKVVLDADLARIYGVTTKRLNEQVKRNAERFPEDFAFQLSPGEFADLRSQIATSKEPARSRSVAGPGRGGRRYAPNAFTEHGAIMAANVLNSPRAVQMSVFVVRAFVRMRSLLADTAELARHLAAIEKELKERLDVHESAIVGILQRIMDIIDPPALPEPPPKKIGFQVRERSAAYPRKESSSRRR